MSLRHARDCKWVLFVMFTIAVVLLERVCGEPCTAVLEEPTVSVVSDLAETLMAGSMKNVSGWESNTLVFLFNGCIE